MKALDTNVLVRFLVRDDERQAQALYKKCKQSETNMEVLFIPLLVVLETIWVLESAYEVTRHELLESIDDLLLMPILEFESQSVIRELVSSAREANHDLSDLLIALSTKPSGGQRVLTFDKTASNFALFQLLE